MSRVLVTGAGGFIGHHLVSALKRRGHWVRGVDLHFPEYSDTEADEFQVYDLREPCMARAATQHVDDVYQLAADMGGIGYISAHHADIARNNARINLNMLEASEVAGVTRYLYTSSACVYPTPLQEHAEAARQLAEEDAWPAAPEPGYGLEKLFSEEMARYYALDYGLDVRIVRFHNIYGPLGTWHGGQEKAPAAICRKVAAAKDGGEIEIWGDGEQTRTFCYIDDCVEGLQRIMRSGAQEPINLGTDELVSINRLVDMVCQVAGKKLTKKHVPGPQGVRGRNSNNERLVMVTGWAPSIPLMSGLEQLYPWITEQMGAAAQ